MDCKRVLECLYSLTELDKKVIEVLRGGGELRSREVGERLGRDQSTAYRSLERLVDCGFAYKEKHTIRKGGYYYTYSARPLDMIKKDALEHLDSWYDEMKRAIEDLHKL